MMSKIDTIFTRHIKAGSANHPVENCSVELLGKAIYGDMRHGIALPCLDIGCQFALVHTQDRMSDAMRNSRAWRLMILRLATCHKIPNNARVGIRVGLWVVHQYDNYATEEMKVHLDLIERWIAGEVTTGEVSVVFNDARPKVNFNFRMWDDLSEHDRITNRLNQLIMDLLCTITLTNTGQFNIRGAEAAVGGSELALRVAGENPTFNDALNSPERDALLFDYADAYLSMWQKIAADEGCLLPEDMEDEYVAFVEELNQYEADHG